MSLKFPTLSEMQWILDGVNAVIDQRPVSDADFKDGETYDGDVWDSSLTAEEKQKIKNKYVCRRKVLTASMFANISGVNFSVSLILKDIKTDKMQPPKASMPHDDDTVFEAMQGFKDDWFLVSYDSQYTRDSNVELHATYKKSYPWDLILLNKTTDTP